MVLMLITPFLEDLLLLAKIKIMQLDSDITFIDINIKYECFRKLKGSNILYPSFYQIEKLDKTIAKRK